ncbi:hypothetical protein BH23ACT11_BH23ACT11_11970 [soil metagenome]
MSSFTDILNRLTRYFRISVEVKRKAQALRSGRGSAGDHLDFAVKMASVSILHGAQK